MVVADHRVRPAGARRCSCAGGSAAMPIAEHIQLVATWSFILFGATMVLFVDRARERRGAGAAVILFVSMYPGAARLRAGAAAGAGAPTRCGGAFPPGSVANLVMAAVYYRYGGWRSGALLVAGTARMRGTGARRRRAGGRCSGRRARASSGTITSITPAAICAVDRRVRQHLAVDRDRQRRLGVDPDATCRGTRRCRRGAASGAARWPPSCRPAGA